MVPPDVFVVILAGGKGTRFWPLSRRALPKQCLSVGGGPTLLQQTVARTGVPPERILVVSGPDMAEAVAAQIPGITMLIEPSARNTAPAIIWASVEVARRGGRRCVVLPSDHLIRDEERFREVLDRAVAASEAGGIVTLGVRPSRPETGFGWIAVGDGVDEHGSSPVERFVEKPPLAVAEALMAGGRHLWNAGMFVYRVDALLDEVRRHLPGASALAEGVAAGQPLAPLWASAEAMSIDYGVLERAACIRVIPLDVGWSDIGSWTALEDVLEPVDGGVAVAEGLVAVRAARNVVHAAGKVVALLGVENLVIVDTPDVLLVARAADAQDVRLLVAELERRGMARLT